MTPAVRTLVLANVVMFLVSGLAPDLTQPLVLIPALVLARPWTVVTYQFLHAGFTHILFNMLGLFFFGPRVEARIGTSHFYRLYLLSGAAGALASFATPHVAIVGASGSVFGVFLAYARYYPRDMVYVWGIIPVQARVMVIVMTALSLFGGMGVGGAGVAHFAHLGGFAGGWLYLHWLESRRRPGRSTPLAVVLPMRPGPSHADETVARWKRINLDDLHPVNREEIARLLAKLEQRGPGGLSPEERATLERFSVA